MKRSILVILIVIISLLVVFPALAQVESLQEPTDDEVNAIAKQLYCPVCENIPLDVCPTQACSEWRELIRLKLSEGWSEDQIKEYFAEQYGNRVLATPPAKGFNLLVFIIPAIGIIVGVILLYKAFKSLHKVEDVDEIELPVDSIDDEYISRLEKEINDLSE